MDVIKERKKKHIWENKKAFPILVIVTSAFSILSLLGFSSTGYEVHQNQLVFGDVKHGNMEITVEGFGILRSYKQALITAQTPATVKKIHLRPGAKITKGAIILELVNPVLNQQVKTEHLSLKQEEASLLKLELTNRKETLSEKAKYVELKSDLEIAKIRKQAEGQLADSGIVSNIDFQITRLQVEQKSKLLDLHMQRIEQLKKVSEIAVIVQKEQINIAKTRYESVLQILEQLTVKAGLDGVLQRLPVELGQNVIPGQELALIGSEKDLVALIQIPQSKVDQVSVGQTAQINTQRDKTAGKVTRITPEVRDGTVEVEISFTGQLPASARPELNVDAVILIKKLTDTLYVERPYNALTNNISNIYKLGSENKVIREEVSFGEGSGRYIQILSGAKEKDRLVISDNSKFNDELELTLIN